MWTFHQRNGQVEDFKGFKKGCGYAGHGKGKNNPEMQDVHGPEDWGPLPAGIYHMQAPVDTAKHGPYVIWLTPDPSNEMFGRFGFGIHGDSIEHPGLASEGCICVPRATREAMWASGDHSLQVIL